MWIHLVVLLVSACVLRLQGLPMGKDVPPPEAFDFMRKFGYITDDGDNSAALFTENGLEDVVREIQKFGALEQTGRLNNETLALMKKPRCGVPDVLRSKRSKRFILGPQGWNKRNLTYFIANWSGKLSEDIVAKYILMALDAWGRYAHLTFQRVYSPDADIIVAFGRGYHGDTYPFDGPGNVLAHAFFPYEYESLGGDIHFDDDEKWTTDKNPEKGVNFYQVAIHELGHSLGLSHSHIPTSVMFPYYIGNGPNDLDYDDILGMYELYIKRNLENDDRYTSTESYSTTDYVSQASTSTTQWSNSTTEITETSTSTSTEIVTSNGYNTMSGLGTISYHGDSETVDEHKTHDTTHNIPPTQPPIYVRPSMPDICKGHYDAIATLRNELFIFKGQYLWRLRNPYDLVAGYPIPFRNMFPTLPKWVKRINAAYQRPNGHIILFTGEKFWIHDGQDFIENSPRPLTDLELPSTLTKLDAVMNWARNGKTYFFRGNVFWRYNENLRRMDPDYPMQMHRWRGVPSNLDAATTFKGITYFFKGRCYWKFDNDWIVITQASPLPTPQTWLGCPKEEIEYCVPSNNTEWEWMK